MVERMKYINLMGQLKDLDRVIEKYISKYDIKLEMASKELYKSEGVESFSATNPYIPYIRKAEKFTQTIGLKSDEPSIMTKEEATELIDKAHDYYDKKTMQLQAFQHKKEQIEEALDKLQPYKNLDIQLDSIQNFKYINYRFGKMPVSGFKQFEAYLYNDKEILFMEAQKNTEYIWCVYFTPISSSQRVDSVFASLHFEQIIIPSELNGVKFTATAAEVLSYLTVQLKKVTQEIKNLEEKSLDEVGIRSEELSNAYKTIKNFYLAYDCRKYAVRTAQDFFIFVGWMIENDAIQLSNELENDKKVVLILENENESIVSKPPTKLKNFFLFRPFEFFVKMYGIPSYDEIDPTPFVALTYSIFFGMMFGDVGQGLLLVLLGLFLYKKKGIMLGSIMSVIGAFSIFFGFMYGSVFGFEDIYIKHIWISPIHDIQGILVSTLVFGMVVNIISMILNIINSLKNKRLGKLLFDPNGIAGLFFYVSMLVIAAFILVGQAKIAIGIIAVILGLPLLAVTFRVPLTKIIEKRHHIKNATDTHKESFVMFLLETLMELVEVLLSYFTNTLSFVRVGGFAISHAGLMSAVMMLAQTEDGTFKGASSVLIFIIGNIFVMILEGMVVGIQVLRLEFYEMFSRYYSGDGKEFLSYKNIINNN